MRTLALISFVALSACGGGGGSSPAPAGLSGAATAAPAATPAPSVSGDMLAATAASKGWNYSGTIRGTAVTFTLYEDPTQSNGAIPLLGILAPASFTSAATAYTAQQGLVEGGIGVTTSSAGYNVGSYVLLNQNGTIYADGGIPGTPQFVPSTLTLGQTFSPYAGLQATVLLVGVVPGAQGCPTAANGATVQYAFQGQNTSVSYVPGCGITALVANGVTFTLKSVGSYPQVGSLSKDRFQGISLLDNFRSALNVVAHGVNWRFGQPFAP